MGACGSRPFSKRRQGRKARAAAEKEAADQATTAAAVAAAAAAETATVAEAAAMAAAAAEKEAAAMPRSNTVGEISTDDLGEWSPNSSLPTSAELAGAGSVSCLTPAAARLRVRLVSGLRRASLPNGATLSVNRGACGAADLLEEYLSLGGDAGRYELVTQNQRARFEAGEVYTHVGPLLLAINPFRPLPGLYDAAAMRQHADPSRPSEVPHVYAVAREACGALLGGLGSEKGSHSIVVSGCSGSGKTETAKHALTFIVSFSLGGGGGGGEGDVEAVGARLLAATPLLEALGNASTARNWNSSRFGKGVLLSRNLCGDAAAGRGEGGLRASIRTYLLETSRVVGGAEGERCFHVFYQLLAAPQEALSRSKHHLSPLAAPRDFAMLSQYQGSPAAVDDARGFEATASALAAVGLSPAEAEALLSLLAALLHLSNVDFDAEAPADRLSARTDAGLEVGFSFMHDYDAASASASPRLSSGEGGEGDSADILRRMFGQGDEGGDEGGEAGGSAPFTPGPLTKQAGWMAEREAQYAFAPPFSPDGTLVHATSPPSSSSCCTSPATTGSSDESGGADSVNVGGGGGGDGGCVVSGSSSRSLAAASALLGAPNLGDLLTRRRIEVAREQMTIGLAEDYARDTRAGLLKGIYARLFAWVVRRVNQSLREAAAAGAGSERALADADASVEVLDIFGFERKGVNSFEQLCINYANEKLHHLFLAALLAAERQALLREGAWGDEAAPGGGAPRPLFEDNQPCLDLFEAPPCGILLLLDDGAKLAGATPAERRRRAREFESQLRSEHASSSRLVLHSAARGGFTVRHFAGDVTYAVDQMFAKLAEVPDRLLAELPSLGFLLPGGGSGDAGGAGGADSKAGRRPKWTPTRAQGAGGSSAAAPPQRAVSRLQPSTARLFLDEMAYLQHRLRRSAVHHVHCVAPNADAAPRRFDEELVGDQLRSLGTAAALQLAFAVRLPYPTLCASLRGHLAPTAAGIALLPRRAAEAALAVCKVPPADYRMGTRALDPSSRA